MQRRGEGGEGGRLGRDVRERQSQRDARVGEREHRVHWVVRRSDGDPEGVCGHRAVPGAGRRRRSRWFVRASRR